MDAFVYRGAKRREISFPIGGIGTGCVGLSGDGRLIDWELFGRPNKQSTNGFSSFVVRTEREGRVTDIRALHGPVCANRMGAPDNYGFGMARETCAGWPHFEDNAFCGDFPIARVDFEDARFRGDASLTAFNPFIPLNEDDSSLPAALFEVRLTNRAETRARYTVCFTVRNPVSLSPKNRLARSSAAPGSAEIGTERTKIGGAPGSAEIGTERAGIGDTPRSAEIGTERAEIGGTPGSAEIGTERAEIGGAPGNAEIGTEREAFGVVLGSSSDETRRARYGELCLLTDAEDASAQIAWYRGNWFDGPAVFWNDLRAGGRLRERDYEDAGQNDHATVAAYLDAEPGESVRVRFVLAWYFPNAYAYWHKDAPAEETAEAEWRNEYATRFDGAEAAARYAMGDFDRLLRETATFRDALYATGMPKEALNAVAANLSLLKSPTCLRLENGSFYGWEGCGAHAGSCEGTCTHVWNYAYALAYLFPRLERSIREEDYARNLDFDGRMGFRTQLPLGSAPSAFRACCDGQFGGIVKMYREWKISGDTAWLRAWWSKMRSALDYAWSDANYDRWDRDKDGVLEGRQHHTLDMELFGPNAWLNGMYLAALKAASEMAEALGDGEARETYGTLFARGKAWTDERLFNGEYYHQLIDLNDRATLDAFADTQESMTGGVYDAYWDAEAGEIKYQIGEGCGIDQVLGQWHADLVGLGDVLDPAQVDSALRSIYRYNYKTRLGDVFNPCRLYGLEEERGTLICAYPAGRRRPHIPVPYAEETMHGFEYQAASHMLLRGMEREGLELVRAVRDRYDGETRNPFNEMECGSNYARSMASYALLLAYSGLRYDAVARVLRVAPVHFKAGYRAFFSTEGAWGECAFDGVRFTVAPRAGALGIRTIELPGREAIVFERERVATEAAPLSVRIDG